MTDEERLSREALVRRAVALAGAVYVSPMLGASASAAARTCSGPCVGGKKGAKQCRKRGGAGCKCDAATSTCKGGGLACADNCQGSSKPCDTLFPCGGGNCGCFISVGSGGKHTCVQMHEGGCSSFPACDKQTGVGCPVGWCCLDTCCPQGLCLPPCGYT